MKGKKRILKIRPFNMANFSGGSGYAAFSLIWQAMATIPASLIIWIITVVKLPMDEDGNIDKAKALKKFRCIVIPVYVILAIFSLYIAIESLYSDFTSYWYLVIFVGLVPLTASYFIFRASLVSVCDKSSSKASRIGVGFISGFLMLAVYIVSLIIGILMS